VRTISHIIEYLALRLAELAVRMLPRKVALAAGAALGRVLRASGVYRRVVTANMAYVGLWEPAEQKRITARLYRNMGRYVVDFLRAEPGRVPHDFRRFDFADRILARGKGAIAVIGHFGNWEALGTVFGTLVPSLHVVSMPMKNDYVERWLARKRARTGVTEIHKNKAVRRILQALHANSIVAILIDQNMRRQGTLVPFLGKPASTIRTVAGLLHKTDCAILLSYALLKDDGTYAIHVEEGRDLGVSRDDPEAFITAYQREHNDVLSGWIREHPEHWFGWFHRRFGGQIRY
jgi:KDO2-lipid IV(A) lauroyltransferase